MSSNPLVGRNGVIANNSLVVSNNTTTFVTANASGVSVGANTLLSNQGLTVGNVSITANAIGPLVVNSTTVTLGSLQTNGSSFALGSIFMDTGSIAIGNSSSNVYANSTLVRLGITSATPTAIGVGSNVIVNSSAMFIGDGTSNVTMTSSGITLGGGPIINSTAVAIGTARHLSTGFFIGNSTSNTFVGQGTISINGSTLLPAVIDIGAAIGDGTNVITVGRGGRFIGPFDFGFTISSWSVLGALESGSIAITLYKASYANYDPTGGTFSNMSGVGAIAVSSAAKAQGTVSGWTIPTVAAGEVLLLNVESVSTFRQVILSLKATKTS